MSETAQRVCRCGRPMELVSRLGDVVNPGGGGWMCAHCDQPCERPSNVCLPCRAITPETHR